jgi:hypothetical protein
VVEVFKVLVAIDPSGHGGDIEAEEGAADGAEGGEGVDVRDLIHGGYGVLGRPEDGKSEFQIRIQEKSTNNQEERKKEEPTQH